MKQIIDWFARNRVVANLLMVSIIVLGLSTAFSINQEVFPEFEMDIISINVPYLGAAPEEVEDAVIVRIEEAIEGLEGVKRLTSTASEGSASVMLEVETGYDTRELLNDVKARVDAISTFPLETEEPVIQQVLARMQSINVSISGNTDELTLKATGGGCPGRDHGPGRNQPGRFEERPTLRDCDRGVRGRPAPLRLDFQ